MKRLPLAPRGNFPRDGDGSRDVGTAGANRSVVLHLLRRFLGSPAQRPFANDIASSMHTSSLPREDLQTIKDLINELRLGSNVPGSVAIPHSPPIELPAKESLGFLTSSGSAIRPASGFPRLPFYRRRCSRKAKTGSAFGSRRNPDPGWPMSLHALKSS